MGEAGVPLLWSWPMLQGSTAWTFKHFPTMYIDKRPWCCPHIAYITVWLQMILERLPSLYTIGDKR